MRSIILPSLLSAMSMVAVAKETSVKEDISFFGCAPLGAYYPPPTIDKSSKPFRKLVSSFTKMFDDLIQNGGSEKYGPVHVNTTSFSVIIFGGDEKLRQDPIFFEYHYTSLEDQISNENITLATRFPVGDVSMVFTVYAWLAKMGEQWETPITKYLPELADVEVPFAPVWEDITIGALAGQVSGLARESKACTLGGPCNWESFKENFSTRSPYFLPDTTPVVSYAAWQLLVFAMEREGSGNWSSIVEETLLGPLNLTSSGVLSHDSHSMLASDLLPPAVTRRWLKSHADTSNLRNGVGRPWEVYRAGDSIRPIVDALTKAGTVGKYASYFGLTTDFNAGFAILAHDSSVEDRKLDLNVHADIVSEVLGYLLQIAAAETGARYAGKFEGKDSHAAFNTTDDGHGVAVQTLVINGVDIKNRIAQKLGIKAKDLDIRIYPTNVEDESQQQFVAVFQDSSALIDMGTPTCITWQEIGADVEIYVRFNLDKEGNAVAFEIPQLDVKMDRTN
ncbi:hypothetical protein ACLX1H_000298 [Fusarium chlamydosporum]